MLKTIRYYLGVGRADLATVLTIIGVAIVLLAGGLYILKVIDDSHRIDVDLAVSRDVGDVHEHYYLASLKDNAPKIENKEFSGKVELSTTELLSNGTTVFVRAVGDQGKFCVYGINRDGYFSSTKGEIMGTDNSCSVNNKNRELPNDIKERLK